jgi:uncharacterized protein
MDESQTHFRDCYALKELPYFKLNERGKLSLALPDCPPIVDFHTHLGFFFMVAPPIEYGRRTTQVKHNFPERRAQVDLDVYSGVNLARIRRNGVFSDYVRSVFTNSGPNATYTVPNLLSEMDRMGVEKSVVLALDLAFGSNITDAYLDCCSGSDRLVVFSGVNPFGRDPEKKIDDSIERGALGLKVHPYAHQAPPDHPKVMKMLKYWNRTGLPVLFHTAFNGLEPSFLRRFASMEFYEKPIRSFPETIFVLGHAGMNYYDEAIRLAKTYDNVWLEIDGQPPQHIRKIVDELGPDRILFGTDWPFYPIVLPLAKTLVATEGDPDTRRKILSGNAFRLLDMAKKSAAA